MIAAEQGLQLQLFKQERQTASLSALYVSNYLITSRNRMVSSQSRSPDQGAVKLSIDKETAHSEAVTWSMRDRAPVIVTYRYRYRIVAGIALTWGVV